MKYLGVVLFSIFSSACSHTETVNAPSWWGQFKQSTNGSCLEFSLNLKDEPSEVYGAGISGVGLVQLLLPSMAGLSIQGLELSATNDALVLAFNNEVITFPKSENDLISCNEMGWKISRTRLSRTEGVLGVDSQVVRIFVRESSGLVMHKTEIRRGVALLVVPIEYSSEAIYLFEEKDRLKRTLLGADK